MPSAVERHISTLLRSWESWIAERPRLVIAACALLTLAAALCAGTRLGIDTDTIRLFPEDLPARVHHEAFVARFPDLENALFIVVDAENAALARESANALVAELRAAPEHFSDAHLPVSDPFFDRHGLLYRTVDELDTFADYLTRMQPVIAALDADPSLATLTTLIDRGLDEIAAGSATSEAWVGVLDGFGAATVEIYEEQPLALSWEDVLLSGASIEASTRQIVVADPILDFDQLLPAGAALEVVRDAAAELGPGVVVRITGNPALVVDETLGLLWDIGAMGLVCLLVVALILAAAFRSVRMTLATCIVLVAGCIWGAAFASLAVGKLNVISMTAGILFLGLGVDYAIHLGTRYMHFRGSGSHREAMAASVEDVGTSLVVCSVTTSLGFFAFLPTDYRGVAEFGLVTGVGLFFMLFLTLTLLPALLGSFLSIRETAPERRGGLAFRAEALGSWVERRHRAVLSAAVVAALLALASLPQSRFEPNIVAMRDPSTESVRAFEDLLADADGTSPWLVNSLASSELEAERIEATMTSLPVVSRSVGLGDFVPREQEEKLEILADLAMLFDVRGGASAPPVRTSEEQIASLRRLYERLSELGSAGREATPLSESVANLEARLGDFLARAEGDPDPEARLAELEDVLLGSLPSHLDRLLRSLEPGEILAAELPGRLVRRMRAEDGTLRVQTFPSEDLRDPAALERFVDAVLGVDPAATGVAVNLVAFGRTTQAAFREALAGAALAIFAILLALWRRVSDVLLVMVPLGLAALLTAGTMSALAIPFSFFNVVAIPLMLGAGVDAGVHLVERARESAEAANASGGLLATTTARAVFYSALTTIVSFGSLGLSAHRGLAGLGTLLTFGMALTVVCNLFVLPALIAWRSATARPRLRPSSPPPQSQYR